MSNNENQPEQKTESNDDVAVLPDEIALKRQHKNSKNEFNVAVENEGNTNVEQITSNQEGVNGLPPTNISNQDCENKTKQLDDSDDPEDKPRATITRRLATEPTLFVTMCAVVFQQTTSASLIIDKICRVTYNYSDEICRNYTHYREEAENIETLASDYSMYKMLIETLPAMLYVIFLGSWSDKYTRKFLIIVPIFGYSCCTICNLINSYYTTIPPIFVVLSSFFIGLSGGVVAWSMGCFSYISDITNHKTRTKRIVIADLAAYIALPIGNVASSAIYEKWKFIPVYSVSLVLFFVSFIYCAFYLQETIKYEKNGEKSSIILDLFNVQNVKKNLKVLTVKRKGNYRFYIISLLIAMIILLLPVMGEIVVMLLFVRTKFDWEQPELGYYNAFAAAVTALGSLAVFWFILKRYKVPDLILGVISLVTLVIRCVIVAISTKGWMVYAGAVISFLSFSAPPTVRSFTSKLVDKEEVGKLFAAIAICEGTSPILASIIYSQVYNETREEFPGAMFVLSASILFIPISIFIWIFFDMKKSEKYEQFENADKEIEA